jgi:hypothetical protein
MPSDKKGITVRFEEDELARIEALAKKCIVNPTTVIRWGVNAILDYHEASGGKITLPLDFAGFFSAANPIQLEKGNGTNG